MSNPRLSLAIRSLLVTATLQVALAQQAITAPAFLWGPGPYIGGSADAQRQVSYQRHTPAIVGDLLDSVLQSSGDSSATSSDLHWLNHAEFAGEHKPQAVLVFIGSQLRSNQLADSNAAAALAPLMAALDAATSSLSLPYLTHQGSDVIAADVMARARRAGAAVHHLGFCGFPAGETAAEARPLSGESIAAALAAAGDKPAVLLACAHEVDSLEAEVAALDVAHAAMKASGKPHVVLYASEPGEAVRIGRSLLAKNPPSPSPAPAPPSPNTCDDKCQTQVSQIEAFLLILTILVALGFGTYCMGILDTPTRFATPKDHDR